MHGMGSESRAANDVFFVCSLIEKMGRTTHNRRSDVARALGVGRIAHAVEYADVLHCENIDAVCERYIEEAGIERGEFDNLSAARYARPTYLDMGKVYKRLALGIARVRGTDVAQAIVEAFCSPIAPLIDDYNGSFYYEAPQNILIAHLEGVIE